MKILETIAKARQRDPDTAWRAALYDRGTYALGSHPSRVIFRSASCACGGGCPACRATNDLNISQPGDAAEIEADAIAEKVMRMPAGERHRNRNSSPVSAKTGHAPVDRKPLTSDSVSASQSPAHVQNAIGSGGHPLDRSTRDFFEPRLGHDLGSVRIHTGTAAADSAKAIDAKAYTIGNNVVFSKGQYQPDTDPGKHLLAHELTHTIQQSSAGVATPSSYLPDTSAQKARMTGQGGVRGDWVPVDTGSYQPRISRTPDPDAERAKAVAEAEAFLASTENDDDDENDTGSAPTKNKTADRFRPGGFTDDEAAKVYKEAEERIKLLNLAITLAEKQAKRREFWDGNPSNNSSDVKEAFDLDLYWDPAEDGFIRQPYVSKQEAVVDADPEARALYRSHLWDLTENKPVKKSRFKKVMDFVCEHTNPCHDNIRQYRADKESGMSDEDAKARGLFRIATTFIPSKGPKGPIDISKGGPPIHVSPGPVSGGFGGPALVTPGGTTFNPGSARQGVPFFVPTAPFPIPDRPPVEKPSPPSPDAPNTTGKQTPKVTPEPVPTPAPAPTPKSAPDPVPLPFMPFGFRPYSVPDVDTDLDKRQRRGRCTYESIAQQFGRYPCHAAYATSLSGVSREVRVTARSLFASADFDAIDHGGMLYEVKTGYRWLVFMASDNARANIISRFWNQAINQLLVAEECGHELRWYFNDPYVASFFGAENSPYPQYFGAALPVAVWYVPFNCDQDSDG